MKARVLRAVYSRMSISTRLMFGAYLGTPLQAALPWPLRWVARVIGWLNVRHHD